MAYRNLVAPFSAQRRAWQACIAGRLKPAQQDVLEWALKSQFLQRRHHHQQRQAAM